MADMMEFPESVYDFMEQYKMTDIKHVYSNGTEYVPIYRMKQWFEHVNQRDFQTVRHGMRASPPTTATLPTKVCD